MELPQSLPLQGLSLTLSAWEGPHQYASNNSWGANLGPDGSMVLFPYSLPYSWGSSLVNTQSHWALPKG